MTRLASGLPVGADLEYADEVTLGKALVGRRALLAARARPLDVVRRVQPVAPVVAAWAVPATTDHRGAAAAAAHGLGGGEHLRRRAGTRCRSRRRSRRGVVVTANAWPRAASAAHSGVWSRNAGSRLRRRACCAG